MGYGGILKKLPQDGNRRKWQCGVAGAIENVEVGPTKEPVEETPTETNAEEERSAVEDGKAQVKAFSKDSTASDEAVEAISPKAKQRKKKKKIKDTQREKDVIYTRG